MTDAPNDAWAKRWPVGWKINDGRSAADLEEWRDMCRQQEARGREVEFITAPIDPNNYRVEHIRRPDHAWDVNGSDWTGDGRLGGMGKRSFLS